MGNASAPKVHRVRLAAVDFELTPEQREIQALAREFARPRSSRTRPTGTGSTAFPTELYPKLAELGLMGVCVPEEYGGAGADFVSYILVLEELSRADAGVGVTVAVHTSAVTLPILRSAPTSSGRGSCRRSRAARGSALRADRAGGRLGCGVAAHAGGARRRRLAHRRLEAVDHERRVTAARSCSSRARTRARGRARGLGLRPRRRARAGHARRGEARAQLVGDERHRRRCARRRRSVARRGGQRLPDRDGDARRRPDRDRRAGGRDRAGCVRRRARLRAGAEAFGQPIGELPGDPAQAREHVDGDRRGAAARATAQPG